MATKAAAAAAGAGAAERLVTSAYRVFNDVVSAVGDGIRARNEFSMRIGQGADPIEAATAALRRVERH